MDTTGIDRITGGNCERERERKQQNENSSNARTTEIYMGWIGIGHRFRVRWLRPFPTSDYWQHSIYNKYSALHYSAGESFKFERMKTHRNTWTHFSSRSSPNVDVLWHYLFHLSPIFYVRSYLHFFLVGAYARHTTFERVCLSLFVSYFVCHFECHTFNDVEFNGHTCYYVVYTWI